MLATVMSLQEQSFAPAIRSFRHSGSKLLDFMYGTPDRVKLTMAFAFALLIMGMSIAQQATGALAACPV